MSSGILSTYSEWEDENTNNTSKDRLSTVALTNFTGLGNSNTNNRTIQLYDFYRIPQLIVMTCLFVVIMVGNVSLLIAICLSKKRTRMTFFIMHLAIADMLAGVGNLLPDLIWKFTIEWRSGYIECKLVKLMQGTVTFGSTYVLVAMSIDRLDAIARPLNFRGSGTRNLFLIIVAWGFSLLFSIPMAVLYDTKEMQGLTQCWMILTLPHHWQLYITLISVALFFIPAIIIAMCYMIIVDIIWSRSSILSTPSGTPSKRNNGTPSSVTSRESGNDERKQGSQGLIPKAKIKTVKMTLTIVLVFILCWSPYFVFDLLDVYGVLPITQTRQSVSIFVQSLASLNSAANPIIYCLFSNNICVNWRRFECCDKMISRLCPWAPRLQGRLHQSFYSNSTTYCTVNSEGESRLIRSPRQGSGYSSTCRRNSGTPFIKPNLSLKENQILMRHLSNNHKYVSGSDSTIGSAAESSDGLLATIGTGTIV
ncbi:neuropeptide S receptor-like [Tubulanus polymorphus]|uniref:neuropeptide S receptor-like n=1 Tax=Tubulanus polymorphus TaxID=672921 RepID=UPI003DA55978